MVEQLVRIAMDRVNGHHAFRCVDRAAATDCNNDFRISETRRSRQYRADLWVAFYIVNHGGGDMVRDIAAGEELTDDYGSLRLDAPMRCACGSAHCRGEIRPDDPAHHTAAWRSRYSAATALAASATWMGLSRRPLSPSSVMGWPSRTR